MSTVSREDHDAVVAELQTRIEVVERALKANMTWIGPPPTDPHSFDSVREEAWALGIAALAKEEKDYPRPDEDGAL